MKAMQITSFGDAGLFRPVDLPRPEAGPGQVLVRVAATSVNPADTKARELGHALDFTPALPAVLGMDFAGWIEDIGDGVTGFTVGDEVFGCAGGVTGHGGALAEFMAADARLVAHKPKSLAMVESAALPLVSITAWEALFERMRLESGSKLLVHGVGGVGHIAIQLAKARDIDVWATVSDEERAEIARQLGAEPIRFQSECPAQYVDRVTGGIGFDAVFDTVGSENIGTSFEAARLYGQVATTVSLCTLDLTQAHLKSLSLHVIYMLIPMIHNIGRERHGEILREVACLVDEGLVRPIVDKVFTLDEVAEAHRLVESGRARGKVVIRVATDDDSVDASA